MPHYYFDLYNGHGPVIDEEGSDLADQAAARAMALDSIRSMVSEDVGRGIIDLTGRIEVKDKDHTLLLSVTYLEAFQVRLPDDTEKPGA